MVLLRIGAIVSILASIIGYGLSGMASDDRSRPAEAHLVQALQLVWFATSLMTPLVDAIVAFRRGGSPYWLYAPMLIVAIIAITSLATY